MHWITTAIRGTHLGNVRAIATAVKAYPWIGQHIKTDANGTLQRDGTVQLEASLRDLMTTKLERDLAEIDNAPDDVHQNKEARRGKLLGWLSLWKASSKKVTLVAARREDDTVVDSEDESCDIFAAHWGKVFGEKSVDLQRARDFLELHARPFPAINPLISREKFEKFLDSLTDSAVGPDGIPYSAWKNAPKVCKDALYSLIESLLFTSLEPGTAFNWAWLTLLGKGEDALDTEFSMTRKAKNTRPLSLSNTDSKICAAAINIPLSEGVSSWALHHQRGFVLDRQLLDNVIDIDAHSHIASILAPLTALLALFDFEAAFPSVAWEWIYAVLSAIGMPPEIMRMIKKLYTNCRHFLRFCGRCKYAFTPKSGTKQGCPLSGTIFVLLLDPIIAALAKTLGPRDVLRGYADDLAVVLFEGMRTLKKISVIFEIVGHISGLKLKITKTILIPLGKQDMFKVKAIICDDLPQWIGVLIQSYGKYLGFYIGPGACDNSWVGPAAKWADRVKQIKSTRSGLHFSASMYNTTAITTLSFVAQLVPVTQGLLKQEASILNSFAGARGAITPAGMHNLSMFSMPISFKSLQAMSMASLFRVAHTTSKLWRAARGAYNAAGDSDDAPLCGFAQSDNTFMRLPIFSILEKAIMLDGIPRPIAMSIRSASRGSKDTERKKGRGTTMQAIVYPLFLSHTSPFDLSHHLSRRLLRWPEQFPWMPNEEVLTKRAMQNLHILMEAKAPCVIAAALKTYCNGWLSARRFRHELRTCLVGCGDKTNNSPGTPDDSLEHYSCCPAVMEGWERCTGTVNTKGPSGFLGLADETNDLITARCAYIYCTYTVIVKLQVRRQPVDSNTFLRMVDERRRFIEAQSPAIAAALRTVRVHGWRGDRSLATSWTCKDERSRHHLKRALPL